MNESTEGVTLLTSFVFDVLREYEAMQKVCRPAFDMAKDLDRSPGVYCSMNIYNDVCTWIEQNIGSASIRKAGIAIGSRIYDNIIAQSKIKDATPLAMMESLKWAASVMIRDPQGRGWEIYECQATSLVMRRTQTFNCVMQEGLLLSLVDRTGVLGPDVEHRACTRRGDEFCEYRLSWFRNTTSL
jgi:hypothetical protein